MPSTMKVIDSSIINNIEDVNYKDNCNVVILDESAKLKLAEYIVKNSSKKVIIYDYPCVISEVKKMFGNIFSYKEKCI